MVLYKKPSKVFVSVSFFTFCPRSRFVSWEIGDRDQTDTVPNSSLVLVLVSRTLFDRLSDAQGQEPKVVRIQAVFLSLAEQSGQFIR